MSILGAPQSFVGAPDSRYKLPRFCEQQHLDEILRVADDLREAGHPIADTDDPHELCQDIAHALWSPYVGGKQTASYPVTKTLLTALMLFGFSSPAEALKSGQQVCAPTVCMLNGGKDLTRSTYMKEYVAPNHPDKGGDLQASQFFNDCGRELFQDSSSTLSCANVKYDKPTEKAVNKYIAGASKREEAAQKKEKEHVLVKGRLDFINDPEVMESVDKVKKILQSYGYFSQAINSRSLEISVQDANVVVANMKSFIQKKLNTDTNSLVKAKEYKQKLETKIETVKREWQFAETFLNKTNKIDMANPDMADSVQTSNDIHGYIRSAWSLLESLSASSLAGLHDLEEYVILARKSPTLMTQMPDDPINVQFTPRYDPRIRKWLVTADARYEKISETEWREIRESKIVPDSVTAKALEVYFKVRSNKTSDVQLTYQNPFASDTTSYEKTIETLRLVAEICTEGYETTVNQTSDFLKQVESYESRFGPVVPPSITTHTVWSQWDESVGVIQALFVLLLSFLIIAPERRRTAATVQASSQAGGAP